jgi:hypothetical protein
MRYLPRVFDEDKEKIKESGILVFFYTMISVLNTEEETRNGS